jgi:hypothetical protein
MKTSACNDGRPILADTGKNEINGGKEIVKKVN